LEPQYDAASSTSKGTACRRTRGGQHATATDALEVTSHLILAAFNRDAATLNVGAPHRVLCDSIIAIHVFFNRQLDLLRVDLREYVHADPDLS
jgi:hypothetical protein